MSGATESLQHELARMIVEVLNLEDIDPGAIDFDAPLFGDGLGLDSIDALEIGATISKRYGIKLKSQSEDNQKHFSSISALAAFVHAGGGVDAQQGGA